LVARIFETMGRPVKRRRRCSSNEQDDDSLARMPLLKMTRLANDSKIGSGVTLHRRLRGDTLQHSILLGDLVAVQAHDHDPPSWPVPLTTFPYSSGWRLAQVVAFDDEYNMSVRWFRSLSKTDVVWQHLVGPKQPRRAAVLQVTDLDPHLVFEDDVTATIPVSHVLPAVAWPIFCKCTHRLGSSAMSRLGFL
jgi:hypothetical protein